MIPSNGWFKLLTPDNYWFNEMEYLKLSVQKLRIHRIGRGMHIYFVLLPGIFDRPNVSPSL